MTNTLQSLYLVNGVQWCVLSVKTCICSGSLCSLITTEPYLVSKVKDMQTPMLVTLENKITALGVICFNHMCMLGRSTCMTRFYSNRGLCDLSFN